LFHAGVSAAIVARIRKTAAMRTRIDEWELTEAARPRRRCRAVLRTSTATRLSGACHSRSHY